MTALDRIIRNRPSGALSNVANSTLARRFSADISAVVARLQDVGVTVIFRLYGDTSLPFYNALATRDHGIWHVLTRDERSAKIMADAYARLTGREATSSSASLYTCRYAAGKIGAGRP